MLARISHHFSGNSHTLSTDLPFQPDEAVLLEHCPRPAERQSQSTEQRFSPRTCEKYGLARVSHQHSSQFGQTVLPDAEENPEGRVILTLPRDSLKADDETDDQSDRKVGEKPGLILCGFFCGGKTTVGRALAEKRKVPFIDTDWEMQRHFNNPDCRIEVSQIWCQLGEKAFRSLESKIVASLPLDGPAIIATGGGSLLARENRTQLKKRGVLVYLHASLPVLWERMEKKRFPATIPDRDWRKFEAMACMRVPIYETVCDWKIKTDGLSLEEIIRKINEQEFIR